MKYFIILFQFLPFYLCSQSLSMGYCKLSDKAKPVLVIEADKDKMTYLNWNKKSYFEVCEVNTETDESVCNEVETLFEDDHLTPIKVVRSAGGEYYVLYSSHTKSTKEIFRATYDVQDRKVRELTFITSFISSRNRNIHQSGFTVYQSLNQQYTSIMAIDCKNGGLKSGYEGHVYYVLLDKEFQLIKSHVSEMNYFSFFRQPYKLPAFVEATFINSESTLTDEGRFFYIHHDLYNGYVIMTCDMNAELMNTYELDEAAFANSLPMINQGNSSQIELWYTKRSVDESTFQVIVQKGSNGVDFDKKVLTFPNRQGGSSGFRENDNYLHINSIEQVPAGDIYISMTPLKNSPMTRVTPYSYKIEGLFILKLKDNELEVIHEEHFEAKVNRGSSYALHDTPFVWSIICDSTILYSFVIDRRISYALSNSKMIYTSNMLLIDYNSDTLIEDIIEVPEKYIEVEKLVPEIHHSYDRSFEILQFANTNFFFLYGTKSAAVFGN